MNKPVSAKCYSRILNDLEEISPKMRRSRKLSWKKGGVDCELSRRERDIPNTFTPTTYQLLRSALEIFPSLSERYSQSVTWNKTFSRDATSLASYREDWTPRQVYEPKRHLLPTSRSASTTGSQGTGNSSRPS